METRHHCLSARHLTDSNAINPARLPDRSADRATRQTGISISGVGTRPGSRTLCCLVGGASSPAHHHHINPYCGNVDKQSMAINNWKDFLTSWVPAGVARRTEADAVCGNEASVGITEWGNHRVYTRITLGLPPHPPTTQYVRGFHRGPSWHTDQSGTAREAGGGA